MKVLKDSPCLSLQLSIVVKTFDGCANKWEWVSVNSSWIGLVGDLKSW